MTYFIIICFFISFVVILAMIGNKLREIQTGRGFVSVNLNADDAIRAKMHIGKKAVTELPKHFVREAFHFAIQKIFVGLHKIAHIFYPKIAHIVETVKGKDIPKNKGGASFFLSDLREHKENLKR